MKIGWLLLVFPCTVYSQNISVSGFIGEKHSKESLPYVNVSIKDSHEGTYSNAYGFYTIQIPANKEIEVVFSSIGYMSLTKTLISSEDIVLDVQLIPKSHELEEVIILSSSDPLEAMSGKLQLPLHIIKEIPTLLGEKDVIKTLQLLPGVQAGIEGSTALYVRGGGPGQNLILLDDAQVYNANHLFGFLSVFNGDAIKGVSFWKGGSPARYGGRISSVLDIQMKDGNKEKLKGEGGIGLVSSRLTLEGPLKKGSSSFLVSSRRSYLDLLTRPFMSKSALMSYRFYDLNAKLNFDLDDKNKVFISGYFGDDQLVTKEKKSPPNATVNARTNLGWGNSIASIRWNHLFNNRLFSNTTLVYSNYNFTLIDDYVRVGTNSNRSYSKYNSTLTDYSIKIDFDYNYSNKHNFKSGLIFTSHFYTPRDFTIWDKANEEKEESIQKAKNKELGIYIEDSWQPSETIDINAGVRFNGILTSSLDYFVIEPRLSLSYEVNKHIYFNASYARNNQFVHLLSNTGIGLSTDLWVPATLKAGPEQADQVSVGLSKDFKKKGFSILIESYRKYMRNIVAYKDGAIFLGIEDEKSIVNWEDNITSGKGQSYGTEVLLKKSTGRVTGWLGYTISWTVHQFEDLNQGKKFYPRQDSRHNIALVGKVKLSNKTTLSANWVYKSGNTLNVPQGFYYGNFATGAEVIAVGAGDDRRNEILNEQINRVPYFGSGSSYRTEAYHRLDIAIQLHKKKEKYERYWEFGLYNVYNRKNPFYYYLTSTNDPAKNGQRVELKKKSLFPIIPSISYNIKF